MRHVIGNADEFWRLRLSRVDTSDNFDFEWREDILYREPTVTPADEVERWTIEAVAIADYDTIVIVATFPERDEAEAFYERAKDDLQQLTKSQFDTAYLSGAEPHDAEKPDDEDSRP